MRRIAFLAVIFVAVSSAFTQDAETKFLLKIESLQDFNRLARVFHPNTPYALPHLMFVIDRKDSNKIYFINSNRYRFHKDFLFANYLIPRGSDVFKPIYVDENRRFIVGTIAWQKTVGKFTWELWEGDKATRELILLANDVINSNFFDKVYFKPNSVPQEEASMGLPRVLQSEILNNQGFTAYNVGRAIGRVHVIEKLDDTVEIGSNEILVLRELPMSLPPVRGIIVAKPSTPLSHVNILAKGWGIPNAYIKDADKLFAEYHSWWVEFEVTLEGYRLKRLADFDPQTRPEIPPEEEEQAPPANLEVKRLASLSQMRKSDSVIYGSKAANLGEILAKASKKNFSVPDGFAIPFYWYDRFMKDNGFDKIIYELIDDYDFVHNPRVRREKLAELRRKIQYGRFSPALRAEVLRRWRLELRSRPVFVRSSSNTEDLPNFSGAGLYSSVKNVRNADKLIEAIKYVWASLWNFEAYEARVRNYVSQTDVYMGVLVQVGINMDKGGVMITADPFEANRRVVYISAVCGHNSLIPDNKGVPEQILYNPDYDATTLLTLSEQKNALTFSEKGDLKEIPDRCADARGRILSDSEIKSLSRVALEIHDIFGGEKPQDIEWGIMRGKIYILQSRPYIEK
ncbi:MAG: PEP/pyruvate-binding domain-containing protein [Pyrinomonadaceae bacterium]|nr:PEP/pyruvate-binding domain-containing protein [Pyrinomonadaceae bacterium]MCX7640680.1 PEP/pyruvate-binding domain-containing protein [Pyrinomonadaceae bacterium]MDW8305364.1 PEP/pyruvate-binding domain-containing protein [Acidobacteriota bacterium]